MNLPVVLRHPTAEDLLAACDYLETQQVGLSARLVREIRGVIDRISIHPELHGTVVRDVRRGARRSEGVVRTRH